MRFGDLDSIFQGHGKTLNAFKCIDTKAANFLWPLELEYSVNEPILSSQFVCPFVVWPQEAALTIIYIFRDQIWSWIMSQVRMGLCTAGQMAVYWDALCSMTWSKAREKKYTYLVSGHPTNPTQWPPTVNFFFMIFNDFANFTPFASVLAALFCFGI